MKSRISNKNHSKGAAALVAGLFFALASSGFASFVDLGSVIKYTILGTGGTVDYSDFEVYQSDTYVQGNIGMGPHSQLTHGIDATITGVFDYDLTSTLAGQSIAGVGTINQIDMSGVVADARAASTQAAGYTPTQTYATLTENQTITGVGGLNVINVTGDVALKKGLTITGPPDAFFVFQFTSPTTDGHTVLLFSGMTMTLSGGVQGGNIIWDLNGTGGDLTITSGAVVFGTFLAPDRDIYGDHALVGGRLIGGGSGNTLSVHSSSEVAVPEAGTWLAGSLLLTPFGAGVLRALRRSKKA